MSRTFATALAYACPVAMLLAAATAAMAGEAKTPLGKWMKPHMGAPLAGQDFSTLQQSFDLVGSKPPGPAYPQWAAICKTGSAAAAAQNLAGVKAACKQCHDSYKEQYIKDFPTRAFP